MIKSMTGFAALTCEDERATVSVTIRTVNHRHLDLQLRSPQALAAIEAELRALVAKHVARGRVELKLKRDSTLEYHLNVYNPAAESFTAAHIYRSGNSATPVVTLFAGTSLRDKYIQVRGTGVLTDPAGRPLLEELRSNPAGFYVSLRTTREPQGALRGTIQ